MCVLLCSVCVCVIVVVIIIGSSSSSSSSSSSAFNLPLCFFIVVIAIALFSIRTPVNFYKYICLKRTHMLRRTTPGVLLFPSE